MSYSIDFDDDHIDPPSDSISHAFDELEAHALVLSSDNPGARRHIDTELGFCSAASGLAYIASVRRLSTWVALAPWVGRYISRVSPCGLEN